VVRYAHVVYVPNTLTRVIDDSPAYAKRVQRMSGVIIVTNVSVQNVGLCYTLAFLERLNKIISGYLRIKQRSLTYDSVFGTYTAYARPTLNV